MKAKRKANDDQQLPDFVVRAERAFRRVARNLRAESRRSGLPAVVFRAGSPISKRSLR